MSPDEQVDTIFSEITQLVYTTAKGPKPLRVAIEALSFYSYTIGPKM